MVVRYAVGRLIKSLVFVPFQNSLLGLVFLLVPNSEYTMTLQVLEYIGGGGSGMKVRAWKLVYASGTAVGESRAA